ncbi:MAG: ASKHA domain-containing protein, partial [Gaiellaceae bacterium]
WGMDELTADPGVLPDLQRALLDAKGAVTLAVHDGSMITAAWPGLHDRAYGIAFDIGSTTVAGHLCDLLTGEVLASAGEMNPQIRFGEDLMSRVSYVMLNPGSEKELTKVVRGCLAKLTAELASSAEVDRADILEVTLVGNPIMHHLLLGIDPTPLGGAPFALTVDEAVRLPARDLGLPVHRGARAYVLPCIAGHVGADSAGVILSEGPHLGDEVNLIVDVGTNAEIVLGNRKRLLAASSPTGPAFEGAQISCGQRAAPGAIERVRIDPETLEPRVRVIGCEAWSDESKFAGTQVSGVCGSGIIEAIAELHLAGVLTTDGTIDGALADRTARVVPDGRTFSYVLWTGEPELVITQNDVRQIQLAKAALYAGCALLMERYGIERVDRIRLAGAFGTHLDPVHALVLGLVPDCDPERVTAAGNAAGTGARIALLNRGARTEIEDVVRRVEKVETAVEPRFQEFFVNALAIPHDVDPYPRLARKVRLPARRSASAERPARARRRERRPA